MYQESKDCIQIGTGTGTGEFSLLKTKIKTEGQSEKREGNEQAPFLPHNFKLIQ